MIPIWMLLKVFSDSCVCFAILGAFPKVFPYSDSLIWPALLCGIGAGVSSWLYESGKPRLSCIGILFSAAALILADGTQEMLILLPVVGYTGAVIFRGQFRLEYYAYRQYFTRNLLLLAGLYVILSMLSYIEGMVTYHVRTIDPQPTFQYLLVYAVTGVVLQRQLRMGMVSQSQGSFMDRAQLAVVLGGTGAVIFGFLTAEPVLRQWASAAFNSVIGFFGSIVMVLYDWAASLINDLELKVMYEQIQEHRGNDSTPSMGPVFQEMIQQAQEGQADSESYWWVLPVLSLLIVVMIQMLRSFRKQSSEAASTEQVAKVTTLASPKASGHRTNRGKIRHYYREFLRLERKRGMKLKKHYTTEDILQRISPSTNREASTELRNLYLRARYDDHCAITQDQVEAARSALKKIRN